MKNPSIETLQEAADAIAGGMTRKAAQQKFDLNYSQLWLFTRRAEIVEAGLDVEATAENVRELRKDASLSWGEIACRCGVPESKVRKLFTETTDLKSQGQRIGKGGRFYYGERGAPLYEAELRPTGTDIPKGAKYEGAITAAVGQRLIHLEISELRTTFKDYTGKDAGKRTKAQLVVAIRKAMAPKPVPALEATNA